MLANPNKQKKSSVTFKLVQRSKADPAAGHTFQLVKASGPSAHFLPSLCSDDEEEQLAKEFSQKQNIPKNNDNNDDDDEKIGEAARYGVFFDDSNEYDYMQHLKKIGEYDDAVFIGPNGRPLPIEPNEVAVDTKPAPFHVDVEMSEHLKGCQLKDNELLLDAREEDENIHQIFEALDDNAYCIDEFSDDFFKALNNPNNSTEWGIDHVSEYEEDGAENYLDIHDSNNNDPLNQQFEEILKIYEDGDENESETESTDQLVSDLMLQQLISRQAEDTGVVPDDPMGQLAFYRSFLGKPDVNILKSINENENHEKPIMKRVLVRKRIKKDCESIEEAKENHILHMPTIIDESLREKSHIRMINNNGTDFRSKNSDIETESQFDHFEQKANLGKARPRSETTEEKKIRKAAIKTEKKNRRQEKKENKKAFS